MKHLVLLLCASACFAQPPSPSWEFSGAIGYGSYRDGRVTGPGGEAKAGIHSRFAAGASVTENLYDHLSGEIRYLYQGGDRFVTLGGKTGSMAGQSHAFTYEVLLHPRKPEYRLRPFVAVGAGAKYYRSTGAEPSPQPAAAEASLVRASEWRFLASVGGGVSYRLPNHILVRADFRDHITPWPRKLFVPGANASNHGFFQMFSTTFGVGYWF